TSALGAAAASIVAPALAFGAASALGSIASQTFSIAAGIQDSFSWKAVASSGLAGAVTAGVLSGLNIPVTGGTFGQAGARGAVQGVVGQGVNVAMGVQQKFDWRAVAASAVASGVGNLLGGSAPGTRILSGLGSELARKALFGGSVTLAGVASSVVGDEIS